MEMMEMMGALWLIVLVAINLMFGVFVGWVAGQKGRSVVGWFFASIFLTPVIALLGLIAVGDKRGSTDQPAGVPHGEGQERRWWG